MESQPISLDELTVNSKAYRIPDGRIIEVECIPYEEPLSLDFEPVDENEFFIDHKGTFHFVEGDFHEEPDGTIVYTRHYIQTNNVQSKQIQYQEI